MVVKVFASRANRQASTANEVFNCQRAAELVPTRTSEVVGFTEELAGAKGSCAIVFIDGGWVPDNFSICPLHYVSMIACAFLKYLSFPPAVRLLSSNSLSFPPVRTANFLVRVFSPFVIVEISRVYGAQQTMGTGLRT